MKKSIFFPVLFILLFSLSQEIFAQNTQQQQQQEPRPWWQGGGGGFRRGMRNQDAKKLPLIKVQGNKFVNEKGDTILFRGVAISDPDKVDGQGHWDKNEFEQVKAMGATLVRIPVHPAAWRSRTPQKYLQLLDQAVQWCTDLDMYVMIDWHSIGNLGMELFQNPMYNTTKQETYQFWHDIAQHFRGNNTVAFYEFFNEPTTYRGQLGSITWAEWKEINENLIKLVRAFDPETIPLIAGFDWAYDLANIRLDPIDARGIGYTCHPYSNKRSKPWVPKWEEDFGFAADNYPVVVTEFGFGLREGQTVGPDDYPYPLLKYLEGKGISWVGWCFDPQWGPQLLKSWNYDLTPAGEYLKKAMHLELDFQKK